MKSNPPKYWGSEGDGSTDSWIDGNALTDRTPSNNITGLLFPYNGSVAIYHCPADRSTVLGYPQFQRFRSYMLSTHLNGNPIGFVAKTRYSELLNPAGAFAFLDASETAISDGAFFVLPLGSPSGDKDCMDSPSDRHSMGANLSFADERAGHWRWRWSKQNIQLNQRVANDADLADLRRLQQALP
ncbi:MAG: hypothetical protein EXS36_18820 [Pedosphaera sp.]|nr:hypothetical protein [Pedosphaera sp.]